ncbi:unnamed protein product [Caenorhabditis auriculariae]|uniref:Uncharacterized protein n=1 Tax=Caenorhabditis auriculariae TaxID=2777116 RepID=A0A8S1HP41_9PELO|nr:unnamed protein product [Caenorhabditis auriculariae]
MGRRERNSRWDEDEEPPSKIKPAEGNSSRPTHHIPSRWDYDSDEEASRNHRRSRDDSRSDDQEESQSRHVDMDITRSRSVSPDRERDIPNGIRDAEDSRNRSSARSFSPKLDSQQETDPSFQKSILPFADPDEIRDGIVYESDVYSDFLEYWMAFIQSKCASMKMKSVPEKPMETITVANRAEKQCISFPYDIKPEDRQMLLHCDLLVPGLPPAIFFGSGFGLKAVKAKGAAAKDFVDKCNRLGLLSSDLHMAISADGKFDRRKKLPAFALATNAMVSFLKRMAEIDWPVRVLEVRVLEPDTIQQFKDLFREVSNEVYHRYPALLRPLPTKKENAAETAPAQGKPAPQASFAFSQPKDVQNNAPMMMMPPGFFPPPPPPHFEGMPPMMPPFYPGFPYPMTSNQQESASSSNMMPPVVDPTAELRRAEEIIKLKEQEMKLRMEEELAQKRKELEQEIRKKVIEEERAKLHYELAAMKNAAVAYSPSVPPPSMNLPPPSMVLPPPSMVLPPPSMVLPPTNVPPPNFVVVPPVSLVPNPTTSQQQQQQSDQMKRVNSLMQELERKLMELRQKGDSATLTRIFNSRAFHYVSSVGSGNVPAMRVEEQVKLADELSLLLAECYQVDTAPTASTLVAPTQTQPKTDTTRVHVGNMTLRPLTGFEQRRLVAGDKVIAQDMKNGKWTLASVMKVSGERVTLSVQGTAWRKNMNELYIEEDYLHWNYMKEFAKKDFSKSFSGGDAEILQSSATSAVFDAIIFAFPSFLTFLKGMLSSESRSDDEIVHRDVVLQVPVGSMASAALKRGRLFGTVLSTNAQKEKIAVPPAKPPVHFKSKNQPQSRKKAVLDRTNIVLSEMAEVFGCSVLHQTVRSNFDGSTYLISGFDRIPSCIFGGRLKLLDSDVDDPPTEAFFTTVRNQFLCSFKRILHPRLFSRIANFADNGADKTWRIEFFKSAQFREMVERCTNVLKRDRWSPLFHVSGEQWNPYDKNISVLRTQLFKSLESEANSFWTKERIAKFGDPY